MKKLLIIPLLAMLCSCEGVSEYKCQQAVEKMFPDARVWRVNKGYTFIVEDSLHLYYVETMSVRKAEVTDIEKLR